MGFTLVELMIAVAISGIIFVAIYQMLISQRKSFSLQNDITEMQQTVRASETMMVREIRMAGYKVPDLDIWGDVPSTSFTDGEKEAFEEAIAQSVAFTSDVDGDGKMETIRYSLKQNALVREMWRWDVQKGKWKRSGGGRTLSEHIELLHFSYWILADDEGLDNNRDDDGDLYVDEEGELLFTEQPSREEREHLRMVRLTLTAKTSRPDPDYIHPLYGDHFRRITLTSTIQPRNVGL
jgi:prepilin-type N-terminal cleavage/methylation domain-containing protein